MNATIYYTHRLTALSADADTNDWLSAAEDLIVHHATADMLANVLRAPDSEVAKHKQWEAEAYNLLMRGTQRRMGAEETSMKGAIQRQQEPKPPITPLPGIKV